MSVTIIIIDPNDPISDGPADLNANFQAVKTHIEDLEALLSPSANTLKLTNLATIPANSIEAAGMTLTAATGNAFVVAPSGGAAVATIDVAGNATVNKIIAAGLGVANRSEFQDVLISGSLETTGGLALGGVLDLTGGAAKVKNKMTTYSIVDANTGASATNPIDIAADATILLDYNNSGIGLANGAEVNLDLTNVEEGQEFTFYNIRNNSGGVQALYNGLVGAEIFAYFDPAGSGITTISNTVKPTFVPGAAPDTLSYLKVRYTDIGGGTFRLLVLDSKNVNGVG